MSVLARGQIRRICGTFGVMASEVSIDKEAEELGFRFIRDLDAESEPLREALLGAVESMAHDDRELRKTA